MSRRQCLHGMLLAWCWHASPAAAEEAATVPWEGTWRLQAAEASVELHQGREALKLRNGAAWLADADFRDGVIRFELNAGDDLGFYGVAFRAVDDTNHEHVYVRPFLSDKPDATQYTPVFHGVSGWQLYADERFAGALPIATHRWVHVELRIADARAELYVDGERVVFPALQRAPVAGAVGITASLAPARFANVSVSHDRPALDAGEAQSDAETARGLVQSWVVSTPFDEDALGSAGPLPDAIVDALEWTRVGTDVRGIVNLARTAARSAEANTVLAGVTLRSDAERLLRLRFGFSDRVTVYLDGRPLYRGADGWRSRDYRFLGTVGLHDELVLPLRRGDNVLRFAVSEDFGGWGVTAALPDSDGIEIVTR